MGVTTLVKKWLAGTYSNYGFMVKDATESGTTHWTTFYSSDASSPNKPELIINYNGNNYNEGYDSQLSSAIGTVKLKLYVEDIYPIYMNCSYNASIDIDYYYQKVNNLNKVWLGISDINTYIIDTRYLNYGYCFLGAGFDNHIVKESSTVRNSDYQEHYVSASHASDPDDKYANYRYKFYNSFPYGNTALYWGNYSGSDCSDLTINSIINVYGDQRFGSNKDTINLSLKKNK